MEERVHLFGIRHHGPGSAASLLAALEALQPASVLIEGPPEADALIEYAAAPGMRPPLALLAHAPEQPGKAIFFPFAEYSPEWQAMRWALRTGRPVRFIDWPAAISLAAETEAPEGREDPLDRLAEASGHADGEALWNALVESRGAARGVFAAIEEAMISVRETAQTPDRLRETRREAHMRLEIRKALKAHDGEIAVVTGAWHVPALRRTVPMAEDRATLRDLPRLKVEISWVPWTEPRLAASSGYGAGVASPGWYGHLWRLYEADPARLAPEALAATWLSRVGTMLRAEGASAATASIIEATRLATALAAVRDHAAPGLDEMRDATLSALCHGDETAFRLIERRLVVGEAVGTIDESVPQMPLAADLAWWQRRLRLKPEAIEQEIALDLRSEAGFAKSVLLHRLDLLGVPWGRLVDAGAGRGTFREIWRLAWVPELSVRLAEALVHGITIEQAAAVAAVAQAAATEEVAKLAELVRRCLLSDLPEAAETCVARLQAVAVNAVDIVGLMRAVPSLVSILRYGTARKMPVEALGALARALSVEIMAGIGLACRNLDDEAAEAMRRALTDFDAALGPLGDDHLDEEWKRRLALLADDPGAVPLVAGLARRRLYDRAAMDEHEVAAAFSRALSPSLPPKSVGQWLDGFLGSAAEVIIHDRPLFALIDDWIAAQEETDFMEVLPMLRRAFGSFDAGARRRLLAEIGKPRRAEPLPAEAEPDSPGFEKALPLLFRILGMPCRE
jgi:hypothetical protein